VEILLLKDVPQLGKAGQSVRVKDGYAQNFLVPRGLALPASKANQSQVQGRLKAQIRQMEAQRAKAAELSQRLSQTVCTIAMPVGAQGKLHGAVTASDILESLRQQGVILEKHQVALEEPLTHLGSYQVSIKLYPEVTASLKIHVVQK